MQDIELIEKLTEHGFFSAPQPSPPRPSKLSLQLTNRCNLACHYCCTNSGVARANELDTRQWCSIVSEACDYCGPELRVGMLGGEPLLFEDFDVVGQTALDRGADLTLFTNGALLDHPTPRSKVQRLLEHGAKVRVSLAAAAEAQCDSLSEGARYAPTLRGLRELERSGHLPQIDVMLFPETVESTSEHLMTLRSNLPKGARVSFGIAFCGGREVGTHVFASRAALESALDRITFDAGESVLSPQVSTTTPRRDACHCAFGMDLSVRSDGALFNCFRMEEPIGRYQPGNLGQTWQATRNAPKLAVLSPTCKGCPIVTLCGGGCRTENLLITGEPDLPDCGPWRVQVLSELLAENQVFALEWSSTHLRAEAKRRGIALSPPPGKARRSLHVIS
jgi:radical SAM protein with 4Fe4S-binding SPASM domain